MDDDDVLATWRGRSRPKAELGVARGNSWSRRKGLDHHPSDRDLDFSIA